MGNLKTWIETYSMHDAGGIIRIGGQENFMQWLSEREFEEHARVVKMGVVFETFVWVIWEAW